MSMTCWFDLVIGHRYYDANAAIFIIIASLEFKFNLSQTQCNRAIIISSSSDDCHTELADIISVIHQNLI